jgi:hypothetical protein
MKVKDLISKLSKFNPEANLVAIQSDGTFCQVYSPYEAEEAFADRCGPVCEKGDVVIMVNN